MPARIRMHDEDLCVNVRGCDEGLVDAKGYDERVRWVPHRNAKG